MTDLERPVIRRGRFLFSHYRKRIVMAFEASDIVAIVMGNPGRSSLSELGHCHA